MLKTFKVIAREITKDDGTSFTGYRAVQKDRTLIQCRFTKTVTPPTETSIITVDSSNMNVSHKREYPVLWISQIEEIAPVRTANSTEEVEEMF